jgi:predicted metalloprotease with PDZ domain
MIEYRITPSQLHAHRFDVTLTLRQPAPQVRLSLPVWIPGSYLVREFARHLLNMNAKQGGKPCTATQLDKATWLIDTQGRGALVVSYEVYAFDTSVRAAFLDSRRGFFNGTGVFLRVEGQEDLPHRVQIQALPKGWAVATSLPATQVDARGQGWYEAESYDALVDHPVELGQFWRGEFTARGVKHELVVTGATDTADLDRLLQDTKRICEAQITFWHGRRKAPFSRYVFLLNVVEDGYGGLEHRQSTALICARKDLPRKGIPHSGEHYTTLLGLISHEYFHTWNVKRLKPSEFAPYDYTGENYTEMLWFFEGFTSYYDDLFLRRIGQVDGPNYLKLLVKPINQVQATPGRHVQSVAQASFDAWTRYYRPDENTANATVSYYTKGSLVALGLDLALREGPARTDGSAPSLDGMMHRLWALQRPITQADVAQALEDEGTARPHHAKSWTALLDLWVHGRGELPLNELLARHGVGYIQKMGNLTQQLGARVQETPQGLKVQAVMHGSPAERGGLCAGDELIAINQWRLRRTDDITLCWVEGKPQQFTICRDQRIETLTIKSLEGDTTWCNHIATLALMDNAQPAFTDGVKARRQAWLGC